MLSIDEKRIRLCVRDAETMRLRGASSSLWKCAACSYITYDARCYDMIDLPAILPRRDAEVRFGLAGKVHRVSCS